MENKRSKIDFCIGYCFGTLRASAYIITAVFICTISGLIEARFGFYLGIIIGINGILAYIFYQNLKGRRDAKKLQD